MSDPTRVAAEVGEELLRAGALSVPPDAPRDDDDAFWEEFDRRMRERESAGDGSG